MALDPLAREVVRDGEHERVVVDVETPPTSLNQFRKVVSLERSAQTSGHVLPEAFRRQLALVLHAVCLLLDSEGAARAGDNSSVSGPLNEGNPSAPTAQKTRCFAGKNTTPHDSPQLWTVVSPARHFARTFHAFSLPNGLWTTSSRIGPSILFALAAGIHRLFASLSSYEADLSAERAQAEAEAWLPRPHVHARRPCRS